MSDKNVVIKEVDKKPTKPQIVNINHEDYGLKETKAKEVALAFKPMLDMMEQLEDEYNELITQEVTEENTQDFKDLRLRYVKIRKGTEKIHKEVKAFYLQGGRFVDGWKNAQIFASSGKEKKLQEKENYFVNLEEEKRVQLLEKRTSQLIELGMSDEQLPGGLDVMDEKMFEMVKVGYKAQLEKIEEDRLRIEKEDEDRRERELRDKMRSEKIRDNGLAEYVEDLTRDVYESSEEDLHENIKKWLQLKAEKLAKESRKKRREEQLKTIWNFLPDNFDIDCEDSDYEEIKSRAIIAKVEKEKADKELELKNQRLRDAAEMAELKRIKDKEDADKKLLAEQKKAKDLQDEIERLAKAERDEQQRVLNLGDEDRFKELLKDLETIKTKYDGKFKSDLNKKRYSDLKTLIDKILNHIKAVN